MPSFIDRVNKTKLKPTLLIEAVAFVGELPADSRTSFEARTISLIQFLEGKVPEARRSDTLLAINFRLEALAHVMIANGARGWRLAGTEDGQDWVHEDVIRAAAEEPLVETDGHAGFDSRSFHRRLLSIATPAGNA